MPEWLAPGARVCIGDNRGPVYEIRAIDAGEAWLRGPYANFAPIERLRPAP